MKHSLPFLAKLYPLLPIALMSSHFRPTFQLLSVPLSYLHIPAEFSRIQSCRNIWHNIGRIPIKSHISGHSCISANKGEVQEDIFKRHRILMKALSWKIVARMDYDGNAY
jgi:hypothetical protein